MVNDNQFAIFWLKQIKEKYIQGGDDEFDSCRKRAIDIAIKELEKPEERWIPVSERLPEDGSNVLAYYDNKIEQRMFACVYEDGEWFYRMLYTTTVFKYITHWMPLPEPPQKGGGGE